jgi:hypothetical protein
MSVSKWVVAAVLSLSVAGVAMAEEEEGPRQACVEIPCFDTSGRVKEFAPTWKEGVDIQEKLIQMEIDVNSIGPNLKIAIGVAEDAPLETAIAQMKDAAGDKLIVSLESGGMPTFSVADDAPENVKTFADAGNAAAATLQKITADAKSMEGDITKLGSEASDASSSMNAGTMKANGLKMGDLKGELAIVKHNKEAAKGLKDRSAKVVTESTRLSSMLAGLAG